MLGRVICVHFGTAQQSVMRSGEGLCGCGDDLIVWHVAQVLRDIPPMPERVLKLAVQCSGSGTRGPSSGTMGSQPVSVLLSCHRTQALTMVVTTSDCTVHALNASPPVGVLARRA
jgi:hypothetical protein